MTPQELIDVFQDTQQHIAHHPQLQMQSCKVQASSRLYLEKYASPLRTAKSPGRIDVRETTTFQCARDCLPLGGKIAVLNFANPYKPGGGVLQGARAQEECLCRCSTLYNALNQPYFLKHYYRFHSQQYDNTFSDRIIYSPDICVFKSDDPIPRYLEKPFWVDVITCAAPFLSGAALPAQQLEQIYLSRLQNILETAMGNNVDILILGAFGCGAFRNDPRRMAKAFSTLLVQQGYARYFKNVIFAIKPSSPHCPNVAAFRSEFSR